MLTLCLGALQDPLKGKLELFDIASSEEYDLFSYARSQNTDKRLSTQAKAAWEGERRRCKSLYLSYQGKPIRKPRNSITHFADRKMKMHLSWIQAWCCVHKAVLQIVLISPFLMAVGRSF
jgi:hypothetical protein